jgi:hypothetical protein
MSITGDHRKSPLVSANGSVALGNLIRNFSFSKGDETKFLDARNRAETEPPYVSLINLVLGPASANAGPFSF